VKTHFSLTRVLRYCTEMKRSRRVFKREKAATAKLFVCYFQMRERLDILSDELERFHRRIKRLARNLDTPGN